MKVRQRIIPMNASWQTIANRMALYIVQKPNGDIYRFYPEGNTAALYWDKSVDGGRSWSVPVQLQAAQNSQRLISVWYDRWSGINSDVVHIAYVENSAHDLHYRSLDTSSDTLSSDVVVFAGASVNATGGMLSICRARGGNLYIHFDIDGGSEIGFYRSTDAGATWAARTMNETGNSADTSILQPGFAADNQDMMLIYHDGSADELSRYVYDDSADSWAETSIDTGLSFDNNTFKNFDVVPDLDNNQLILIYWDPNVDTASAALRCVSITESAITALTAVVASSTDDQGCAALCIDTVSGRWFAIYAGKTDGSETWSSAVQFYYKISTDEGATWGAENPLFPGITTRQIGPLITCPRLLRSMKSPPYITEEPVYQSPIRFLYFGMDMPVRRPAAHYLIGG